ncbi:animal-type fatty acid synthase and related proteins [Moesziomyces antarcticus T-34]|uniref:Animal-type fatty acid synthase and related proteins n=1 Tax=Pseudozyma antarctica (strain T-34) TaxID=1151754 RepID=M9LWM4_PSEA3|nr:animal-type fatty acid synthase and related proteins [Moesziomyces antarcticus T-34]
MSDDSKFSSFENVSPIRDPRSTDQPSIPAVPIILFGSQGSDFLGGFDAIFALSQRHAVLAAFLSLALGAIRDELRSVANRKANDALPGDIELLPHLPPFEPFSDLKSLVSHHRHAGLTDPVVNGVLLSVLQTANVVAVFCAAHHQANLDGHASSEAKAHLVQAWKAVASPSSHLLGFCTGALSAFSVRSVVEDGPLQSPRVIWSYIQHAVKAIRACFWISLRSAQARHRLVGQVDDSTPVEPWSIVVAANKPNTMTQISAHVREFNEIEHARPLDNTGPLVITAIATNQVSIGGCPQKLQLFRSVLTNDLGSACRVSRLEIFAPYHSPELEHEASLVMLDLERRGILHDATLPSSGKTIWETVNAQVAMETSVRDMLRTLVESNLCRTADWDAMTNNLILREAESSDSTSPKSGLIVSFGPGIHLAGDLRKRLGDRNGAGEVTVVDVPTLLQDDALRVPCPTLSLTGMPLTQAEVHGDEVVVVSMACRFPGNVRSPEQLWTCLETGRTTVTEIPKHLFDIEAYHGSGKNQTMATHMHALSEDAVRCMDARLFSMSPKEIEQLDPQHRLVMLCSFEALERAGYSAEANSPSSFDKKRIAVCMGSSWDDYRENASWSIGSYFITGNIRAFIPGHVSFSLNMEGPSLSVDSLECSAVSAIQWSRRALLSGQCDVALTGAVNVMTQPQMFIAMDKQGMLSHSGTNLTFSSKHDGATRGEGCGILLLKRRSTAIQDGDNILATVSAARTVHHGARAEGENAVAQQSEFLAEMLREGGVSPTALAHIEASGFHTQTAEAVEIESFARLFARPQGAKARSSDNLVSVASSRPNLGAGEAVSAMASVMKAVLILNEGIVPRQISIPHLSELQPRIAATCASSPLFVPTQAYLLPDETDDQRRHAILVNSLASTGCHGAVLLQKPKKHARVRSTVLEEPVAPVKDDNRAWILVLSAKTKESAEMLKKAVIDYLQREVCLADLSYSLACRRTHQTHRLAIIASDQDELIRKLRAAAFTEATSASDLPDLAFFFETIDTASVDVTTLADLQDRCDESISTPSMLKSGDPERSSEVLQMCLASLLEECGVRPSLVAGQIIPALLAGGWIDKDSAAAVLASADIQEAPSLQGIVHNGFASILTAKGETILAASPPDLTRSSLWDQPVDQTISKEILPGGYVWISIGELLSLIKNVPTTLGSDEAHRSKEGASRIECSVLPLLADLYRLGYSIRWIELFRPHLSQLRFIETLPTYPFHLQPFWMEYRDRNLLNSTTVESEGPSSTTDRPADTAASSEEIDDAETPTQALLSAQVSSDEHSSIFISDLAGQPQSTLLKLAKPAAISVELMVEAAMEARSRASVYDPSQLARRSFVSAMDVWLPQAGHELLRASNVVLDVSFASKGSDITGAHVRMRSNLSSAVAGELHYLWIQAADAERRWSKLQTFVEKAVSALESVGERLDAKLIYKSLGEDGSGTLKAIRSGFLSDESREVVFVISVTSENDAAGADLLCGIPALLSSLEECLRWYKCNFDDGSESRLAITSIDFMDLDNDLFQGLDNSTSKPRQYMALVTPGRDATTRDATHGDERVDVLLLNGDKRIIGQLDGARLGKFDAPRDGQPPIKGQALPAPVKSEPSVTPRAQRAEAASAKTPVPPTESQRTCQVGPVGAADEVHAKVLGVLASELGIALEEMKPQVKFVDLGLDSLMSLVCISTLESLDLGFALPQSLFMECSSPHELLAWIREQVGDKNVDTTLSSVRCQQAVPAGNGPSGGTLASQDGLTKESVDELGVNLAQWPTSGNSAVEETMATIISTIEKELGVAEGSIDEVANLADLGMDSLMSLLVLGNLSSELTIQLPSSLFMDHTSLREIRRFLESELGEAPVAPDVATRSSPSAHKIGESITIPEPKAPVLMRKGTGRENSTPVFLLPDGSGMSTIYQFLPAIDRDVYAINSPFLADASVWKGGIAQIARYYLSSMRLVQPEGPYLVGGWSFGGMAAFEIARLLATQPGARSDRAAGVFLLDSPCPAVYAPLPFGVVDWILSAPELRDIAPAGLSPKLAAHFRATVESIVGYRPTDAFAGADEIKIPRVWYIVADKQLPGRVEDVVGANETVEWLFRANRAASGTDGWHTCIPHDHLTVAVVATANHFTLVRMPGIAAVADILQPACHIALSA